jgi:magnesium transporter
MTLSILTRQATGPTVLNEPTAEDLAAPDVIWIDLLEPSRSEEQLVEEAFGIDAPSEAERAALEESARFYLEDDAMVLHATVVARAKPEAEAVAPTKLPLLPISVKSSASF